MKKIVFLFLLVLLGMRMNSQTVLFSDDFESYGANFVPGGATAGWRSVTFTSSNNRWEVNNAACRLNGNRSLMITNNGTTCQYRKNDNCDKIAYNATAINATGYSCMYLNFNYQSVGEIIGTTIFDYLQVYYSLNGTTWTAVSNTYYSQATTASLSLGLPNACDGAATLYIGFDWINDNSGGTDVPAIIDDIVLTGYASPSAPANNTCASATNMTFTSGSATATGNNSCATADLVNSGCFNANRNVWYSFTATSSNYYVQLETGTMTVPCISVIDFATACVAAGAIEENCTATLATTASMSLCGLTVGDQYYVMVDNYTYGKPGTYTLSITEPIVNDASSAPSVINSCGTSFNSTTIGATNCDDCDTYGQNLDCNNGTNSYGATGRDVGFSVENSSWYVFCATGVASYTVTMTNTGGCTGTNGLQMAAFTGTPGNLTGNTNWGGTAGMNVLTGNSFTTATAINLTAGQCAYVVVDGYAGTNCNYALNVTASPSCVLPVEILYFKGNKIGSYNLLKWATAYENKSEEFILEKSKDAYQFVEVGRVKGAELSNYQINYSLIDEQPYESGTYYRLKQVDSEGGFTYTNVIFINEKTIGESFELIDALPNPNNGTTKIHFNVPESGQLKFAVYDLRGILLFEKQLSVQEGNVEEQIDLTEYADGMYFISASLNDGQPQNKYIVKSMKE